MQNFPFKKTISIAITLTFLFSDLALGAHSNNKSFFQNKRPNYQRIIQQNEELLNKKKAIHTQEDLNGVQGETKIELASLKDISDIHIPENLGKITEVWNSPLKDSKRIIHFQDLHTQYDAQKNSAKLIEQLYKTYGIDLILSEGAFDRIDVTFIKELVKNRDIREKTSGLLMKTGELTGHEYVVINKDYPFELCGVENKALYDKNVEQFNNVIKYSQNAQVFLNQVEQAIEALRPIVYNKQIKDLEDKEALFNDKKLELNDYLSYLIQTAKKLNLDISNPYINLNLLQESLNLEKTLKPEKIQEELRLYITVLTQLLTSKAKTKELEELTQKSLLFQQEKLSPIKFYSFLKTLGDQNNTPISDYKNLYSFTDYLDTVSKLETYKVYQELTSLLEELKYKSCQNEDQKTLLIISKNASFLKDFFNLKVSNEELEYFLNNKDSHKVSYFKEIITNLTSQTNFIDYNSQIIDDKFQELEDFYNVVWERDKAIVENSLKRMQDFKEDSSILIVGGFHTKGMTMLLRENKISYIVLSADSNSDVDDNLYHDLLAGKRKGFKELIPLAYEVIKESLMPQLLVTLPTIATKRFGEGGLVVAVWEGNPDTLKANLTSLVEDLYKQGSPVDSAKLLEKGDDRFLSLTLKDGETHNVIIPKEGRVDVVQEDKLRGATLLVDILLQAKAKEEAAEPIQVAKDKQLTPLTIAGESKILTAKQVKIAREVKIIAIDFGRTLLLSDTLLRNFDLDMTPSQFLDRCLKVIRQLLDTDPELEIHIISGGKFSLEERVAPGRLFIHGSVADKEREIETILQKKNISPDVIMAIGDSHRFDRSMALGRKDHFILVDSVKAVKGHSALDALTAILKAKKSMQVAKVRAKDKGKGVADQRADDYGDTGAFSQAGRNMLFGLEAEKVGVLKRRKTLTALDLDAGLLNRPGARYYFWDGKELKYFVAKGVRRTKITKVLINKKGERFSQVLPGYIDNEGKKVEGDPDEESPNIEYADSKAVSLIKNFNLLKRFFESNKIDYPCYVIASIPSPIKEEIAGIEGSPIVTEKSLSFYIDGEAAHLTRLANIPVVTLGLIEKKPSLALAKFAHERAAFDKKSKEKVDGNAQYRAGLEAELDVLKTEAGKALARFLGLTPYIHTDYLANFLHTEEGSELEEYIKNDIRNLAWSYSSKAGLIAGIEYFLKREDKRDREVAKAIARHYLSSPGKSVLETLACYYILNIFGDYKEQIDSVEKILETVETAVKGNYLQQISLALRLLARCEIPDVMQDKVSTEMIKLILSEYETYYKLCPSVLRKVGLSKEALEMLISNKNFLYNLMDERPSYAIIPTIKILAEFASQHKEIMAKIKENVTNPTHNFSYLIFLGNMEPDEDVIEELNTLAFSEEKFRSEFLVDASLVYQKLSEIKSGDIGISDLDMNMPYEYLAKFIGIVKDNPHDDSASPFYLFMCSEIGLSSPDLIELLIAISRDRQGKYFSKDVIIFGAQLITRELVTMKPADGLQVLTAMSQSTHVPVVEISRETAKKFVQKYNNILEDSDLLALLPQRYEDFVITDLMLACLFSRKAYAPEFGRGIREDLLFRLKSAKAYNEIIRAKQRIELQLARESFDIEEDDYSDTPGSIAEEQSSDIIRGGLTMQDGGISIGVVRKAIETISRWLAFHVEKDKIDFYPDKIYSYQYQRSFPRLELGHELQRAWDTVNKVARPQTITYPIEIPQGSTRQQIEEILAEKIGLPAKTDTATARGNAAKKIQSLKRLPTGL